jgi:hypothetical protein
MRSMRDAGMTIEPETAERHRQNAARWFTVRDRAAAAVADYEDAMATRQRWSRFAEPTLCSAVGAALEEHRREPWRQRAPLKSMEPDPELQGTDDEILSALGLTVDSAEASDHPARAAAKARERQAALDKLANMVEPAEDPDYAPAEAWGREAARQREAVSQPPRPIVRPSERVLEADFEAGG